MSCLTGSVSLRLEDKTSSIHEVMMGRELFGIVMAFCRGEGGMIFWAAGEGKGERKMNVHFFDR